MKIYKVDDFYYQANSKKEVVELIKCKAKDVELLKYLPENEIFISIKKENKKLIDIKSMRERSNFINEPTRVFEIGEMILSAKKNPFQIKESFENNKFYLIEDEEGNSRVEEWQFLFKNIELNETNLFQENSLRLNFYQTYLESLLSKYYHFGVNMNPEYQRELVWTEIQKIDLINSIFHSRDIGKFVFVELPFINTDVEAYEILDGKQRLSTIIEFIEDRFKYKGFYYSQLSYFDKRKFKNINIAIAQIDKDSLTDKNIVEYFVSLNSTGTPVDKNFIEDLKTKFKI